MRVYTFTVSAGVLGGVVYAACTVVFIWAPASVAEWMAFSYPGCAIIAFPELLTDTYVICVKCRVSEMYLVRVSSVDAGVTLVLAWSIASYT